MICEAVVNKQNKQAHPDVIEQIIEFSNENSSSYS